MRKPISKSLSDTVDGKVDGCWIDTCLKSNIADIKFLIIAPKKGLTREMPDIDVFQKNAKTANAPPCSVCVDIVDNETPIESLNRKWGERKSRIYKIHLDCSFRHQRCKQILAANVEKIAKQSVWKKIPFDQARCHSEKRSCRGLYLKDRGCNENSATPWYLQTWSECVRVKDILPRNINDNDLQEKRLRKFKNRIGTDFGWTFVNVIGDICFEVEQIDAARGKKLLFSRRSWQKEKKKPANVNNPHSTECIDFHGLRVLDCSAFFDALWSKMCWESYSFQVCSFPKKEKASADSIHSTEGDISTESWKWRGSSSTEGE